jgi:NitT/TauT family transport system substrate-binding protein
VNRAYALALALDFQPMQSTSATAAAMVSNFVDIGYGTIDTLAELHQKGIPLVSIAAGVEYVYPATQKSGALVVPATSTIHQAKDLNGKTISTPSLHSLSTVVTSAWLDRNGGNSSSVKFVEVPFPAIPAALEAGRIDAGYLAEPFITNGRAEQPRARLPLRCAPQARTGLGVVYHAAVGDRSR